VLSSFVDGGKPTLGGQTPSLTRQGCTPALYQIFRELENSTLYVIIPGMVFDVK